MASSSPAHETTAHSISRDSTPSRTSLRSPSRSSTPASDRLTQHLHGLLLSSPRNENKRFGQGTVADILTASTAWSTPERSRKSRSDSVLRLREASQKRAAAKAIGVSRDGGSSATEASEGMRDGQVVATGEARCPSSASMKGDNDVKDDSEAEDDFVDARSDISFYTAAGSVRSASPQSNISGPNSYETEYDDQKSQAMTSEAEGLGPTEDQSTIKSPSLDATDTDEAWTEETSITTQSQSPAMPHSQFRSWRLDSNVDIAEQIILGEAAYKANRAAEDGPTKAAGEPHNIQADEVEEEDASQPGAAPCDHAGWSFTYEGLDGCTNCKRSQRSVPTLQYPYSKAHG